MEQAQVGSESAAGADVLRHFRIFHKIPERLFIAIKDTGEDAAHIPGNHFPEEHVHIIGWQIQQGDQGTVGGFFPRFGQKIGGKHRLHPGAGAVGEVIRKLPGILQHRKQRRNHFRQPVPDFCQELQRIGVFRRGREAFEQFFGGTGHYWRRRDALAATSRRGQSEAALFTQ